MDPTVAGSIGFGERAAGEGLSAAQVVATFGSCIPTHLDVPQILPRSELCKSKAEKRFAAEKCSAPLISLATEKATPEKLTGDPVGDFGENEPSWTWHPKVGLFQAKRAPPTRYPAHPENHASAASSAD